MKKFRMAAAAFAAAFLFMMTACGQNGSLAGAAEATETTRIVSSTQAADVEVHALHTVTSRADAFSLADVPAYSGEPYVAVHGNEPYFSAADLTEVSFESYSELDSRGRCGEAYASIGTDLMPTEKRGSIGSVKPSGWHTVKYDFIDGNYLYNRCHLIGYQLSGENANEKNLITGTRYLNTEGMLPFENLVADYVKETGNHVLYRVTPVFDGSDLVATGVLMEAESVEDQGEDILYCVFVYNVQPGVTIDYATGDSEQTGNVETETGGQKTESESRLLSSAVGSEETDHSSSVTEDVQGTTYILNTNSKKFHYPSCPSVSKMKESNKKSVTGSRDDVIAQGYVPCKNCNP